ncbi:DUF3874 domain-containing protein [Phocaeicola sartorii]|nr:DUF3874 domain-containing protein [Phocaeicola sartorii]
MWQNNTEFEQISPFEQLSECHFSSAATEKKAEWLTAHEDFQLSEGTHTL